MINVYEKEEVTCVEGVVAKFGRKGSKVYTYLVDGMLIDTGPQIIEEHLIPFYEENSIDLVTLTHSHEDHSGTASWFQENREVPIYVHSKGVEICAQPCSYPKYRQATWGVRKEFTALPLGDIVQSRSQAWEVIYTPGHADDHISLFHKETGRLFTGDLFVDTRTKVIMDSESIPVIMNSIHKLLSYDFGSMFCSHSGYIQDGKKMLKQKFDHLEKLCGEVQNLYRKGLAVEEINEIIFPRKYPVIAISEGQWDSLHIVSSIISDAKKMIIK